MNNPIYQFLEKPMMQFDMTFGFDKKKMRGYSHVIPGITLTAYLKCIT